MRGYVKDGSWYDKKDIPHSLASMEDSYLKNVVGFLERRIERAKANNTEEQLKTNEEFLTNFKSLLAIAQEQEYRNSVKETKIGTLLLK